jgi:hypothetical protein
MVGLEVYGVYEVVGVTPTTSLNLLRWGRLHRRCNSNSYFVKCNSSDIAEVDFGDITAAGAGVGLPGTRQIYVVMWKLTLFV